MLSDCLCSVRELNVNLCYDGRIATAAHRTVYPTPVWSIREQPCTVYSVQCTVYSVKCTVYTLHCTVNSGQYTVYTVQCTVASIQSTEWSGG